MALSVNPPNSVIHDTVSLKHMLWFCCFWRSGVAQASVYGGARRWLLLRLGSDSVSPFLFYSNLTIFDFLLGVLRGVEDPSFRSSSRQRPIYKPD
jgi:hypothetical protein